MITEFSKYKKNPEVGDWIIDELGFIGEIVERLYKANEDEDNKYSHIYHDYGYMIQYYDKDNGDECGQFMQDIDYENVIHYGTREEMLAVQEAEKYNL